MLGQLAATQQAPVGFRPPPPCRGIVERSSERVSDKHETEVQLLLPRPSPCGVVVSRLPLKQETLVRFQAGRPLAYGEIGITLDSDSRIRGSNPCRPTTEDKLDRRASPVSKTGGTLTGLRIETAVFRHKQTEAQPIRDRHRLESGWPDRVGFESSRFRHGRLTLIGKGPDRYSGETSNRRRGSSPRPSSIWRVNWTGSGLGWKPSGS